MAKTIILEMTPGVDLSWHMDGDEIVIDRWEVGGKPAEFDIEMFNLLWPNWVLEAAKEK